MAGVLEETTQNESMLVLLTRLCKNAEAILSIVEGITANPFNKYYFCERRVKAKGRVYRYIEVYKQRPRGAHNAILVTRVRVENSRDLIKQYELESLLHDAIAHLLLLRRVIEELKEKGVC